MQKVPTSGRDVFISSILVYRPDPGTRSRIPRPRVRVGGAGGPSARSAVIWIQSAGLTMFTRWLGKQQLPHSPGCLHEHFCCSGIPKIEIFVDSTSSSLIHVPLRDLRLDSQSVIFTMMSICHQLFSSLKVKGFPTGW